MGNHVATGAQDRAGFDAVYADERLPMLRVAYLIVRSQETAEDIVQDSFAALYRAWDRAENPGGYLRTIVVNRCLTWRTRRTVERRHADRSQTGSRDAAEHDPDPTVWLALGRLPLTQRTAIVLTYAVGLTSEAAAEHMACRPATVRSLVHRGLRTLRKEIEP